MRHWEVIQSQDCGTWVKSDEKGLSICGGQQMTPIESMLADHRASHRDTDKDRLLAVRSELREVPSEFDEEGLVLERCQVCQDDIIPEREIGETSVGIADRNEIYTAALTLGTHPDCEPGVMLPICTTCLRDAERLVDTISLEYALHVVGELKASQWPEFRAGLVGLGFLRKEEK